MHCFGSFHKRTLSKSDSIRHLFNFLNALNFLKVLNSWSNELVVNVLDFQSMGLWTKTTGWLQGQLSLSSFRDRSVEYLKFLGTEWSLVQNHWVAARLTQPFILPRSIS